MWQISRNKREREERAQKLYEILNLLPSITTLRRENNERSGEIAETRVWILITPHVVFNHISGYVTRKDTNRYSRLTYKRDLSREHAVRVNGCMYSQTRAFSSSRLRSARMSITSCESARKRKSLDYSLYSQLIRINSLFSSSLLVFLLTTFLDGGSRDVPVRYRRSHATIVQALTLGGRERWRERIHFHCLLHPRQHSGHLRL